MGVTQNVSQEMGGSSRMAIRLMQPAYVAKHKNCLLHSTQLASSANCKFINTIFSDYAACNSLVDDSRASSLIGPTSQDIENFLAVLEKAGSQKTIYKHKQRATFDFKTYINEGMRLDLLTTGC